MPEALTTAIIPPFTAVIDRCIIKGFLGNRKEMYRQLRSQGYTRGAVLDRAQQLGLSDQFVKSCTVGNPDVALRTCLGCGNRFLSVGFQNRLCAHGKSRNW